MKVTTEYIPVQYVSLAEGYRLEAADVMRVEELFAERGYRYYRDLVKRVPCKVIEALAAEGLVIQTKRNRLLAYEVADGAKFAEFFEELARRVAKERMENGSRESGEPF